MSLRKILCGQPGNFREFIDYFKKFKKECSFPPVVSMYRSPDGNRILLNIYIKSIFGFERRPGLPVTVYRRDEKNSPYVESSPELNLREIEYASRLKAEGFEVNF
ncbi:MAG: hypothetical protein Q7S06_02055 [Nanoarchaeota archaeon]|nr:hypothetical protein [Nanoarchaeota archaeon]